MAVIKVSRNPKGGDQFTQTLNTTNLAVDGQYQDYWRVQFDTDTIMAYEVIGGVSDGTTTLPTIGSTFGGLTLTQLMPKRNSGNPCVWEVQLQYKNIPPQPPSGSNTKKNINIRVASTPFEQDAYFDGNKKPIMNTAGQTFNPTLKKTYYDEELTVSFDCPLVDLSSINQCKSKYNTGNVSMSVNGLTRTFEPKTLLFTCPGYSTIYTGAPPYDWKVDYVFRYRVDTWISHVVDRGWLEKVNGALVPIRAKYGAQGGEPFLLNGKGKQLSAGGQPINLEFDMYSGADFTSLLAGIS